MQEELRTIKAALDSNLALQAALKSQLDRIATLKRNNRKAASNERSALLRLATSKQASRPLVPAKRLYRRWSRCYFTECSQQPEPNADTKRRRQLEASVAVFYHLQPPWTAAENEDLTRIANDTNDPESIAMHFNRDRRTAHLPSTATPRSPLECQIQLKNSKHKTELNPTMRRAVAAYFARESDWEKVAASVSQQLQQAFSAWECYLEYKQHVKDAATGVTSLQTENEAAWVDPEEDALLLKYVAACGPQTVFDTEAVCSVAIRMFHKKSRRQILTRINHSLLNPTFLHESWSELEERKLAIFMKIYGDVAAAATHFARRTKSIVDKWNRSLNPAYSTLPFTKQEDKRLVALLKQNPRHRWTDLSQEHFPHRHPQRLQGRWAELAESDVIMKRNEFSHTQDFVIQIRKEKFS